VFRIVLNCFLLWGASPFIIVLGFARDNSKHFPFPFFLVGASSHHVLLLFMLLPSHLRDLSSSFPDQSTCSRMMASREGDGIKFDYQQVR
jgi:hypothetical protein